MEGGVLYMLKKIALVLIGAAAGAYMMHNHMCLRIADAIITRRTNNSSADT